LTTLHKTEHPNRFWEI